MGKPNAAKLGEKYNSPVKVEILKEYLKGYDKEEIEYLVEGFKRGFKLDYKGRVRNLEEPKNLKSAYEHEEVINKKIKEEIDAGRYLGPFKKPPLKDLTISPLGVIRKKDKNKFRMITHLSHPKGSSINDGIAHEDATVQYASVGDAVN